MNPLQAKANYSRLCQLLICKGSDALRRVLQTKIDMSPPPSTLKSLLSAHKKSLQKTRYSVINVTQWKLLFPPLSSPDLNNFDITLLTILLRTICGLPSPAAGWNVMPPASDTSVSAAILRIKMFRNEVYGHISYAELDDTKFETLWREISQPLIKLGIPQHDIDELKQTALSPEEESYIGKLKEWKELEDNLSSKLDYIEQEVAKQREEIVKSQKVEETVKFSERINELAKCVFKGKVEKLSTKLLDGTRKWFFESFEKWFSDENSRIIILTADPGFGKSVLAAKICELYEESRQLAACHFCDFKTADYRDPFRILQSLASQMVDNVDGFRDKLIESFSREHSRDSLSDTFGLLLNDPLHALDRSEPMLIVVDALDESKTPNEILDLISDQFSQLPNWIKVFISSRPELKVREKLEHLNPLEIRLDDDTNNLDLKQFIQCYIPNISETDIESLVSKCEGSFLYAYYLVNEIKQMDSEVKPNVNADIPKCISNFYEKASERLKKELSVSKCKMRTEEKNMETDPLVANVQSKFYGLDDKGFSGWSLVMFFLHSHKMDFPMNEPTDHISMFRTFCNLTNTVVQSYTHNMTSIISKSQSVAKQRVISELLYSTSKIKAVFGETLHSLDLFESYLKHPKEKTAVSLKHLFDHGKCSDAPPKADEINAFLEAIRSLLISNSRNDKECKKPQDCCQDSSNSGRKGVDLDLISQSNHESTKKNFENTGRIGNGKLQNVAEPYDHNNPGNMFGKRENYFAWKIQELEDENLSLKKQLELRNFQYQELLIELGQITVEKTAKENEEKKSEHFRQIYHAREGKRCTTSDTQKDRSNISMLGNQNVYQNGCQQGIDVSGSTKPQVSNSISNPFIRCPLNVDPACSRERPVIGAEGLIQPNENHPKKNENDENESRLEGNDHERNRASTFKTPSAQPEEIQAHDRASTSHSEDNDLSFSVQQHDSGRESISLSNIPPTSVATTLYNNYKFLLLLLAQKLLSSDVAKLQDWAAQNFSINNPQNATDILLQLDQKGVINASDLGQLSEFFEFILRFDLVYIIDAFLLGDYSLLRQSQASKNHAVNLGQNRGNRAFLRNPGFSNAMSTNQFSPNMGKSLTISRKSANNNESLKSPPQTQLQTSRNFSTTANPSNLASSSSDQSTISTQQYPNKPATGLNSIRMAEVAAAEGPVANERRTTSGNAGTRATPLPPNDVGKSSTVSSNGSKHSKFLRPDNERSNCPHWDPGLDSNWLCSHYKRHCYVKFDCCDKFWPCHRCHNNQSTCGRKKLKSRDTRMLKCVYCNKVQQFGEYCCDCGAKFANYYCGLCKHLTGTDDHPYHCEKCGICRIHGDRSFHCDVCGVCLDVQLRGNHKCRAGSAHDECCICLEDAFTGCQILPCSHKVHKECATQMIRSGITRCPICRESFAHKLERQPQNSRKRPGKH